MKEIKFLINLLFVLTTVSSAHAVSFDCKKASRISEKEICANSELSMLDDDLSTAYKRAFLIDPEIKGAQREWIQSVRRCESNLTFLSSCISRAYTGRIATLNMISAPKAYVTRTEKILEGKSNDPAVLNNGSVQKSAQPSGNMIATVPQPTVQSRSYGSPAEEEVRKVIIAECKLDKIIANKNISAIEAKAATDEFLRTADAVGNRAAKLSQDQKDEFLIFFKTVRDQAGKCENPIFDRTNLDAAKTILRVNK